MRFYYVSRPNRYYRTLFVGLTMFYTSVVFSEPCPSDLLRFAYQLIFCAPGSSALLSPPINHFRVIGPSDLLRFNPQSFLANHVRLIRYVSPPIVFSETPRLIYYDSPPTIFATSAHLAYYVLRLQSGGG